MSVLSWGKPRIIVKAEGDDTIYRLLHTPVDDSTNLETTEGDKTEAKIEGGEVEDVRYDKSTYALSMQIRALKGALKPFAEKDGIVDKNYKVWVVPEDPTCVGVQMLKAHVSMKTSFTANDGVIYDITINALTNDADEAQCQFGTVSVTESGGTISAISFTELGAEADE